MRLFSVQGLAIGFGLLVMLAMAAGLAGFLLLDRVNLAGFVAARATAALGRTVTVRAAHVTPGSWMTLELDDVGVANAEGGSAPVMATLRHGRAEVGLGSLLQGPLQVRQAVVEGVAVLLEYREDGVPNWRPDGSGPHRAGSVRTDFPSLRSLKVSGLAVSYRTRAGTPLAIKVDEAVLASAADDQPVRLTAAGGFQGVPLQLDADLQPILAYRAAAVPFGTVLRMQSGPVSLVFDGTMTQPLDVNGAEGRLQLNAPELTNLMGLFGSPQPLAASLRLDGRLTHSGALWWLRDASGTLEEATVLRSSLRLVEGVGQQPDALAVDVAFDRLDLNEMLGKGEPGSRSQADMSLSLTHAPGTLVDATVSARRLTYDALVGSDATLAARLEPGRLSVSALTMEAFGTQVRATGSIVDAGAAGGRVTAEVTASGADIQTLRRALGFGELPVLGRLEGLFLAEATAPTLNQAVRTARVSALVAMRGGSIAKSVVEKASTDVRSLFRRAEGMSPVQCLLAGMDMRAGVGRVAPLRVRAADGVVAGSARFDLNRRVFDLTVGSDSATTGFFALDVPVRVSGPFGNPAVVPAQLTPEGRAELAAADDLSRLPAGLQAMARRHPCPAAR